MNTKDLISTLGIDHRQLTAWIKQGIPHVGEGRHRRFDPEKVCRWLVSNGIAEAPTQLEKTIADAAKAVGIHPRTLSQWLTLGCPGEPGEYDAAAIRAWRDARRPTKADDVWQIRLLAERAKIARWKRKKMESELAYVAAIRQCLSILKKHLQKAGEKLAGMFGPAAQKLVTDAIHDIDREAEAVIPEKTAGTP
jgi:phage terminase Nu1 subunit (DNA packaging protein)